MSQKFPLRASRCNELATIWKSFEVRRNIHHHKIQQQQILVYYFIFARLEISLQLRLPILTREFSIFSSAYPGRYFEGKNDNLLP
jgi:hypothetical protein